MMYFIILPLLIVQKKLTTTLLLFSILCSTIGTSALPTVEAAAPIQRTFRLSAYYSPLPGQSMYAMGSYEAELRMNGMGIAGASGTPVYPGMIAAPKTYGFGTKIKLDGMGVGTVWDRGGAIVEAGQRGQAYDRLDIWMGHGEEGLKKALTFGKRTVTGYVYPPGTAMADTLTLAQFPIARSLGGGESNTVAQDPFPRTLIEGSTGKDVEALQSSLKTLGYYKGTIHGTFDSSTREAVLSFQLQQTIVAHGGAHGAGVFGPSTKSILLTAQKDPERYSATPIMVVAAPVVQEIGGETQAIPLTFNPTLTSLPEIAMETTLAPVTSVVSPSEPEMNTISEEEEQIRTLQTQLLSHQFYDGPVTGIMDDHTRQSLIGFQVAAGIISTHHEFGAGSYGPKTKQALQTYTPTVATPVLADTGETQLLTKDNTRTITSSPNTQQIPSMEPGFQGPSVYLLQQALQDMGHYTGEVHGTYDQETQRAVAAFQVHAGVLGSTTEFGAGYFGPITAQAFHQEYIINYTLIGGNRRTVPLEFTLKIPEVL